jgi:acetyl/propionyl-CoA carboxylase alpha subunit
MPGLILEISVVVGQEVKENDNLIILGAMKMENSFPLLAMVLSNRFRLLQEMLLIKVSC